MADKQLMLKRFESMKVANFNESLRLEGLRPNTNKSALNPKILAKLKELQNLNA